VLENDEKFYLDLSKNFLKEKPILIDVGTRDGQYIELFLEHYNNAIVHSFEPNEKNYEKLNEKFKDTIIYNRLALDKEEAVKKFYIVENDLELSGLSSLHYRPEIFPHFTVNEITVHTKKLDDYCIENKIKEIDFLKLDIEGNELNALYGAENLLKNNKIKFIQFEYGMCWRDSNASIKDCLEFLKKYEYKVYKHYQGLEEIVNDKDNYEEIKCINYLVLSKEIYEKF